MKTFKNIAIAH